MCFLFFIYMEIVYSWQLLTTNYQQPTFNFKLLCLVQRIDDVG